MGARSLTRNTAIAAGGLRVGFRTNHEDLLAKFSLIHVPGSSPTDFTNLDFIYSLRATGAQLYSAYLGSRVLSRRASLKSALDAIESDLHHNLAKHSRAHLFLHAGVIGWRGKAILFPGRTGTGKSTLVRALIRAGAVYFSDEFAPIDNCGLAHPFLRPLSFRSSEGKLTLRPEQESLKIASKPCTVGAIVATRYVGEGVFYPRCLYPGQAALELLNNTVAVRLDPPKALRYVGRLASSVYAISSSRGEAETTVPALLETLDKLLD